jgi:hypothetical protein
MKITVRIASIYGTRVIYPVCAKANALAGLAGTKSLTPTAIKYIKELGYTIEVEPQEVTL